MQSHAYVMHMKSRFEWTYDAIAKRTMQYNNLFVANNPDHPYGPISFKEDHSEQQYFFANNPDHLDGPASFKEDHLVQQSFSQIMRIIRMARPLPKRTI